MFSVREEKIIKILGSKAMTIEEIQKQLFKGDPDKPLDSNILIANSVNRIIKKCQHHELSWTLKKTRENKTLTIKKGKV